MVEQLLTAGAHEDVKDLPSNHAPEKDHRPSFRTRRLTRSVMTDLLISKLRTVRTVFFDVKISSKVQGSRRIIIVASRKVGQAHVRNLWKRRIKAVFAQNTSLLAQESYTWLFFLKPNIIQLTFPHLLHLIMNIGSSLPKSTS